MRLSRREFLVTASWVALSVPGGWAFAQNEGSRRAILDAFIDTLLPADERSPAASALGVADEIHDLMTRRRGLRTLLNNGCRWLDAQAGGDFTALSDDQRERVVAWMAQAPVTEGPRVFYDRIRREAMTVYYAKPQAWAGLGGDHAPQPRGYIDELFALDRTHG